MVKKGRKYQVAVGCGSETDDDRRRGGGLVEAEAVVEHLPRLPGCPERSHLPERGSKVDIELSC